MAYLPRYQVVFDGCIFHVTWQCHNKDWLMKSNEVKKIYYDLLLKYKKKYGIQIYAYNFMSNHPHVTGKMESKEAFSNYFRVVNNLFAKKYNRLHGRRGQVVMDRFKSPVIETDESALRVMIYIDLNPVRARMVDHPRKYGYTSYHYYAHGERDDLIDPSPAYLAMGDTPRKRQMVYRTMVEAILTTERFVKRNYSNTPFIGDPKWVEEKYNKLINYLQGMSRSNRAETRSTSPPGQSS